MYIVYGKNKGERRFKVLNIDDGALVSRKLYASLIDDADFEKAKKFVANLNTDNPDMEFQLRRA